MEYIRKDGTKVIVEGDLLQSDGRVRKKIIGTNYNNGATYSSYLSSFNKSFTDELIGIEAGIGDIVNTKLGDITDAYELLKTKISNIDPSNIYELSQAALETVDEYFGGIANVETRMGYYYPADFEESQNNKISNLKGKGAAMCVERAALSQNLLKSLGINSYFKSSGIIKNGTREVHSYNLMEYDGKYYIFDSSIPNLINNMVSPLIAEIDKETFTLLSTPISDIGISTTVSHYNPYRDIDVTITYDSSREKQVVVDPLGKEQHKHL